MIARALVAVIPAALAGIIAFSATALLYQTTIAKLETLAVSLPRAR